MVTTPQGCPKGSPLYFPLPWRFTGETLLLSRFKQPVMMKKNIALLAGGNSPEREISLQSAAQVAEAIDPAKYNVYQIDLHGRSWSWRDPQGHEYAVDKNDFSLNIRNERIVFDCALILIHGTPGEDGMLQGYLEMMGIPFPSCGMTSSVITFDKITTKQTVAATGIKTPCGLLVRADETVAPDVVVCEMGLPLFVKPNASGSSFGVSKVKHAGELLPAIEKALAESPEALIEESIEGCEVGCGMMIVGGREYLFPITELRPKREFFDYEAKYTDGLAEEITPADLTADVTARLNDLTRRAYHACRCRGLVRIDFIVRDGIPFLIEVNSIPGMSAGSIVPKQLVAAGLTVGQIYDMLITDTLEKR